MVRTKRGSPQNYNEFNLELKYQNTTKLEIPYV